MSEIIVIRVSDSDERLFPKILDVLNNSTAEITLMDCEEKDLVFPGLIIKTRSAIVLRDGQPIQLSHGEFAILCHLARRPGYVFSREQLYTIAYGDDHYSVNTIPSIICRLRGKIEPDPQHPIYIKTIVGMGYKFEIPKE